MIKFMVQIIVSLLFTVSTNADDSFKYFDDYRLAMKSVSTEMSTGFLAYSSKPWPNGIVPVEFDRSISKNYRAQFMSACKVWSAVASVQCRLRTASESNYLFVTDNGEACWTDVGAGDSNSKQVFNFNSEWCWNRTSLIHEVGHVLGFMHEHQRPDRDRYLKVYPENAGNYSFSYDKLSVGSLDKKSTYDFMSIMHYWNKAYSVNGRAIMLPQAGYEKYTNTMGTSKNLTKGDRDLVRRIYGTK